MMRDTGAAVATAQSTAGGVTFLNVRVHHWTESEQILIGILGFVALMLSIGCLALGPLWLRASLLLPVMLVVIGLTMLLGFCVRRRSVARAMARLFAEPLPLGDDAAPFFVQLARAFEATNYRRGLRLAAQRLAESGSGGLTVRYYFAEAPAPVEPITTNFEPCPLDEVHPTFRGIALRTDELNEADERSESRRFFRRAWSLGVFLTGSFVYFLFFIAPEVWQSRTITTGLLVYLALVAAIIALQYWKTAPSHRALLVPAGLFDRGPRWRVARHEPHLFSSLASVLFVYPILSPKWGWTVADAHRSLSGVGTELEVRTLLRAWLSPLQPPSPKLLSELAGE